MSKDISSFNKQELVESLLFHCDEANTLINCLLDKEEISGKLIVETLRDIIWGAGSKWDDEIASRQFWDTISQELDSSKLTPEEREVKEEISGIFAEGAKEVFAETMRFFDYPGDNYYLVNRDINSWTCRVCTYLDSLSATEMNLIPLIFDRYENFNIEYVHGPILKLFDERLPYLQAEIVKRQIDVDVAAFNRGKMAPALSDVEGAILAKAIENIKSFSEEIEDIVSPFRKKEG